ncbi:MAG: hypothetical protein M5U12_29210 [Verrucomicrobia bacterium]|nr:hypothetical protein [Verrucomicrobiota bacterium]
MLDASQVARLDRHRTEKGQTKFTQLWLATSRAMSALPPAAFRRPAG